MKKILFICHGNICRSPMAEFIFKKMLKENGLSDRVSVASCATSTETIWNGQGEPVYPPAAKELAKHGIDCREKRSVQLKKSDYEKYDMLICMDSNNVRNAMRILGADPQKKLFKLMDITDRGMFPTRGIPVISQPATVISKTAAHSCCNCCRKRCKKKKGCRNPFFLLVC